MLYTETDITEFEQQKIEQRTRILLRNAEQSARACSVATETGDTDTIIAEIHLLRTNIRTAENWPGAHTWATAMARAVATKYMQHLKAHL